MELFARGNLRKLDTRLDAPVSYRLPTQSEASGLQLTVGTLVAFVVGYASIAWLMKFVANHSFSWFAAYRIPAGLLVMLLLWLGYLNP